MTNSLPDDRIFPITKIVAALVIPFLVLAFLILYLFPQESGQRFAWEIKPSIMNIYMGAGYLGGSFLFLITLIGNRWHRVSAGFPAVTGFTIMMLIATILHWSRFDINHFPFQLWLILYVVTPVLVPWLWWRNRVTDPKVPEIGDVVMPVFVRVGVRLVGLALLLVSITSFIWPTVLIQVWPWTLTPLTARVLMGWGVLLGVGNIAISTDSRWSAWRVAVSSIFIWHFLYLIGSFIHAGDFKDGQWFNWYNLSVVGLLAATAVLYAWVRTTQRRNMTAVQKFG
jgi:hypothetical protein